MDFIKTLYQKGKADMDQDTHKMIVETHTMMGVLVKSHDEQKRIMNARLKEADNRLEDHKNEVKSVLAKHRADIDEGKTFRVKVITYASMAAGVIAFFSDPVIAGVKRLLGY